MRTDRYWQNWDVGAAAERIDHYWSNDPFEAKIRQQQALDAKLACGTDVPVFEAGAGSGLMAAALFAAGVTRPELYLGGDISSRMLAMARRRHPTVRFIEFDILGSEPGAEQENVVCFHVLQHLPSYRPALRRLIAMTHRCLHIVSWFHEQAKDDVRLVDPSETPWGVGYYDNIYSLSGFLTEIETSCGVRPAARKLLGRIYSVSTRLAL
jgi:SAM-dependent methyltransferase